MDVTFRAHRSLTVAAITDYTHQLAVKPVFGLSSYRPVTQSHCWRVACRTNGAWFHISADSDFRKKRTRKTPTSRVRKSGPSSKEFTAKARVETGPQRGDKRRNDDAESSVTSTSGVSERAPTTEAGEDQDSLFSSLSKNSKSRVGLADENESVRRLGGDERSPEDIEAERVKKLLQAQRLEQVIEELAQTNFSTQNRMFIYPKVVKPGKDIEVFFNKTLSPLKEEPDILIMGAFNDWCWKSFTMKMEKSGLNGDWWACKIHVPEEAYQIDFVFSNGKDVYDNNNKRDFHITVEGGMDAVAFENFLLQEKQKELEQQAKEQEVKRRKEEQQRRVEEDRAALESHKAQAKAEVEKERAKLQELMKKAEKYVDNLWYLEVCESNNRNLVRLYYNRKSGPLARANEIWIHAGINDWRDGLFISSKLEKSEKKDADWWYIDEDADCCWFHKHIDHSSIQLRFFSLA